MPLTKELESKANEDIINALNDLIDRYLREGVSIYDIKKYFKPIRIFNILLKDIHYAGRRYLKDDEDYISYVRKIFNDVILDRISEIETNNMNKNISEKKIIKFDNFINESFNFNEISIDYMFSDIEYSDNDMDIISDFFKTRPEYISSKNAKYNTYTVTDFKLDVLRNNRVNFDVLILSDNQILKMISNTVRYIVSGLYSKIPKNVEYMGIEIKPHTFMDKSSLKDSVSKLISKEDIINYITTISKYTFESKYGDYYIWKKIK